MVLRGLLQRFSGQPANRRISGRPPSGNGASSFHLFWDVPPKPLIEASVTFEVVEPPTVAKLYFWALQASFVRNGGRVGGAHMGLQHNPAYPDACGVNWGGYHDGAGELEGSISALPSAPDNINTRDYRWFPNRQYRFRIHRSPDRGWRATITDLATGEETVVRDLWIEADHLEAPMMWSEVFADCDQPSVLVRWTDLEVMTVDGATFNPTAARLNYQSHDAGGCANTNTAVVGDGFEQRTTTERLNPNGSRLSILV